jgi:hypothetical protein
MRQFQFAREVTTKAVSEFEALVAEIIQSLGNPQAKIALPAVRIAHVLSSAAPGFKSTARNTEQLRELIAGLIAIVLAGLKSPGASERRRKKSA